MVLVAAVTDWRSPNERDRLVEQLIASERRARVAEAKVRALLPGSDDQVTVLAARVVELEESVSKLNQRIASNRRTA